METKILIFPKNNPIGLISNPQKGSKYNDTLFFHDLNPSGAEGISELQYNYINKYLMNNPNFPTIEDDWFNILQARKRYNWIIQSSTTAVFTTRPENENISYANLRNADFAVVEIKDNGNVEYLFYEVKYRNDDESGLMTFDCELDIFFTYQEAYTFRENTKNFVSKGHTKRFNAVPKTTKKYLDRFKAFYNVQDTFDLIPQTQNLLIGEPDSFLPTQNENTNVLRQNYYHRNGDLINDEAILLKLRNIRWAIIYLKIKESVEPSNKFYTFDTTGSKFRAYRNTTDENFIGGARLPGQKISLPYQILIYPFYLSNNLTGTPELRIHTIESAFSRETGKEITLREILQEQSDSQSPIISCQILQYIPSKLFAFEYDAVNDEVDIYNSDNTKSCPVLFNSTLGGTDQIGFFLSTENTSSRSSFINKMEIYGESYEIEIDKEDFLNKPTKWSNLTEDDFSVENDKNIDYELKMWSSQFKKYKLHNWLGNEKMWSFYELYFENLKEPRILGNINFSPEETDHKFFMEWNALYTKTIQRTKTFNNASYLHIKGNKEVPFLGDAYDQYLRNNRNALAQNKYTFDNQALTGQDKRNYDYRKETSDHSTVKWAGIIKDLIINMGNEEIAKLGINSRISAINAAGIKSSHEIRVLNATLKDLQNIPTIISAATNTEISNYYNGLFEMGMYWSELGLNESDKQILYDKLYQFGYVINQLKYLNDFIASRYYFNYIAAEDVFATLDTSKRNLSTDIKKIIALTYSEGFRIWHIRNLDTFFDVHNYEKENWETEYAVEPGQTTKKSKTFIPWDELNEANQRKLMRLEHHSIQESLIDSRGITRTVNSPLYTHKMKQIYNRRNLNT